MTRSAARLLLCALILPAAAGAVPPTVSTRVDNGAAPRDGVETLALEAVWRLGGDEDDEIFFGVVGGVARGDEGQVLLKIDPREYELAVVRARSAVAQANQTVPTGLPGDPPPGPAMPLTATDNCARLRANAPCAISVTVARLTAPCRSRVVAETPNISRLAALL